MARKGYPDAQMDALNGDSFVGDTVSNLMQLAERGKPQTEEELRNRLDSYFSFCANHDFRPGVESLTLSLSCSRSTFWRWCNGDISVSKEWQEICQEARRIISSFLEQASLKGRLNPATAIFLLKNWENYKDNFSFDDASSSSVMKERKRTQEEIAARHGLIVDADCREVPQPSFLQSDGGCQNEQQED